MTVQVHLWSGLRRFTEGAAVVEVEAATIGDMLEALERAWPGLAPFLEDGVSVSVDGEVIAGDESRAISGRSEIYLLQRLRGG